MQICMFLPSCKLLIGIYAHIVPQFSTSVSSPPLLCDFWVLPSTLSNSLSDSKTWTGDMKFSQEEAEASVDAFC